MTNGLKLDKIHNTVKQVSHMVLEETYIYLL